MEAKATIRFYGALNDFLLYARRETWISYSFHGNPAVKDAIEALGVPHPEIQVIQKPVTFAYLLQPEDRVEVFPIDFRAEFSEASFLNPPFPEEARFVLDVHLGKLAKGLRLLGFDTFYQNNFDDKTIAKLAGKEHRIVLTRDIGLLKQKQIRFGYWLRSQFPETQLKEVLNQFHLTGKLQPFTRCLECNGLLETVKKEQVWDKLPPKTRLYFNEFYQCRNCERVYWKGSHFERMQQFIRQFRA